MDFHGITMVGNFETDNIRSKDTDGIILYDVYGSQVAKLYSDTSLKFEIVNADINSGTIDGTVIGGYAALAGTFSVLTAASGELTTIDINGGTIDGATLGTNSPITSLVVTTADINGGTIDGATIATSDITIGAGKILDVSAGTLTLANDQINGDSINDGTIGTVNITNLTSTLVDINGGAIDGTTLGTNSPITSLVVTTADINGGTIDGSAINNSVIGGTTSVAGTFTTLTASSVVDSGLTANRAIYSDGDKTLTSSAVTKTELGYVAGATSNIQDQLNNKLGSPSLITSRVMITDGSNTVTSSVITSTELGYLDDLTGNVQLQIDSKQATITGAATTIDTENLAASRALTSNASGKVEVSAVTSTELGYLDGVSSLIQTQLNNKQTLDADLTRIAGLTHTSNNVIMSDGVNWGKQDITSLLSGANLGGIQALAVDGQALTSATYRWITFNTPSYDPRGEMANTETFTASESGRYHITYSAALHGNGSTANPYATVCWICKNGVPMVGAGQLSMAVAAAYNVSATLTLTAGDTIKISLEQISSLSVHIENNVGGAPTGTNFGNYLTIQQIV